MKKTTKKRGPGRPPGPGARKKAMAHRIENRMWATENDIKSIELTEKDLAELIKTCFEYDIKAFKYGNLILEFQSDPADNIAEDQVREIPVVERTDIEADQLKQKSDDVEDTLVDLMITDPAAYEKACMEGEITDEDI